MKTIALDLLDCADTIMGKQKPFNCVQHEPILIPRSAKFKFDLTYSKELLFYQRYIVLVEYYASSVQTMQNFLCNQMCALLKLEVEVSRQKKNGETLPCGTFEMAAAKWAREALEGWADLEIFDMHSHDVWSIKMLNGMILEIPFEDDAESAAQFYYL